MRIGIISGSDRQSSLPTKASKLFVGETFEMMKAWIASRCDTWYILSGRHGLIHPDEVVAPIPYRIGRMRGDIYAQTRTKVNYHLDEISPDKHDFVVMVENEYSGLINELRHRGNTYIDVIRNWEEFRRERLRVHPWRSGVRGSVLRHMLFNNVPIIENTGASVDNAHLLRNGNCGSLPISKRSM